MSKSTSWGFTDTVVATKNVAVPDLSYTADYAVESYDAQKVSLVNKTSPLDQLEHLRYQCQEVPNIYKGTSIDPSAYSVSRKGISVAVVLNDTLRVTESTDASYQMDLPVKATLTVVVPQSAYLSADLIASLIKRNVAAWFGTGVVTSDRIMALVRGSMKPTGM